MAKDYRKKNSPRHSGSVSRQLLLVLVCFLSGYFSATMFDLNSVMTWLNAQVLAQHTAQPVAKPAVQPAQLPKPKFEFYTLLTNDHAAPTQPVNNTASVASAATSALPPAPTAPIDLTLNKAQTSPETPTHSVENKPMTGSTKNAFLVQLGSFKSKQEADRIKATLSLKGFPITVVTVSQKNVTWYRVMTGPYPSRMEAEKAQLSIAKSEHLMGMIRRMDA